MASSLVSSLLLLAVIIPTFQRSDADISGDQQECTGQLVGLATCLPYVQGGAKAPTPDCCAGLREVLGKSPKCLCVLIKDHDDPHLGIEINVSLALALPVACDRPVNVSKCPKLLKLPPNSPDAQIFTRPQKAEQGNAPKSSVTAEGNLTGAHQNSGSTSIGHLRRLGKGKRWLRIEMLGGSLLLLLLLPLVALV